MRPPRPAALLDRPAPPTATDGHGRDAADAADAADATDACDASGAADRSPDGPVWEAIWVTGPDAGGRRVLVPGVHRIGRSPAADVRCDDPALAPFHGHLEVDGSARLRLTQLAGRASTPRSAGWTDVGTAEGTSVHVDLGASRLLLRRLDGSRLAPHRHADLGGDTVTVRRAPRALPCWSPAPVEVPSATQRPELSFGGLVPALLAVGGSVAIATVLHQPMFLLLGLVGGVVALGGWAAQQWSAWRRGRRGLGASRAAMAAFVAALAEQQADHARHHRTFVGGLEEAVADMEALGPGLWARRPGAPDTFVVAAGLGDVRWEPHLARGGPVPAECWASLEQVCVHHDAPIPVELGPGARLAVCGELADAATRSLLAQLAVRVGPADWQLVVVSEHPARWSWSTGLPHLAPVAGGTGTVLDEHAAAQLCREVSTIADRHTVVVTDDWRSMALRTSAVRRLAASDLDPAVIVLCPSAHDAPAVCHSVLDTGSGPSAAPDRGRWSPDVRAGHLPQPVRVAGLGAGAARALVARCSRLRDPEDPRSAAGRVPREAALAAVLGLTGDDGPLSARIAARWRAAGADAPPSTPIGVAADGTVEVDLVRDGPHALLAGTTGAGKSELLRALVVGLAARCSPEQITFVLVDYKGGATFDALLALPHVVGLVTDLDEHLAERALVSLRAELQRRERILRDHAATDLAALRRAAGRAVLPRLLVVIDEFAALAVEHAGFLDALVGIAQRGRSLGVHLLLATQRPSGVISDDIRANTNLRIALRLHDAADALDVVGDPMPSQLPRDIPGRAVMRLGPGELVEFQTARLADAALVHAVAEANASLGIAPPHRPWLEPLPLRVEPVACAAEPGAVGIADLPAIQAQRPLRWSPGAGHLVVVGARGAGVTSTLRTVAARAVHDAPGTAVYVIDAALDPSWDAALASGGCSAVVRLHERERLLRVLTRLGRADAAPTSQPHTSQPHTSQPHTSQQGAVLVIDGLAGLRAELDDADRATEAAALARLIGGTASGRVTLALGATDALSIPAALLARCRHRWLLHVNDAHDATALGIPAAAVPPAGCPGRAAVLGAFDDTDGWVEAQIAAPPEAPAGGAAAICAARPTDPLGTLPAHVSADALPSGEVAADRSDEVRLPLGLDFATLAPDALTVPDGEHLLVLGPARSGRSTALVRLARAWTAATEGWVGVLAPRRSALRAHDDLAHHIAIGVEDLLDATPVRGRVLLVIDDAELVDDVGGRLAALATTRRPDLLVLAAGRPDGLRAAYGHWTAALRRSRRGLLMAGCLDTDADLLGVVLPRRAPLAPRPGLAWAAEDGALRLVQVAVDRDRGAATSGAVS